MKIKLFLTDSNGDYYEGETELVRIKSGVKQKKKIEIKNRYQPNSTTSKIMDLLSEGFFNEKKTVKDIIVKFESKDYHFKASDLTLPLRNIVRRGYLERMKNDDKKNKKWNYRKAK